MTDRDFNVRKDSSKEVTAIELDFTDVTRATGNNTVQKDIKGKQPEENPREKGKLSGSGKGDKIVVKILLLNLLISYIPVYKKMISSLITGCLASHVLCVYL